MSAIKPERLTLEDELNEDIATLSVIAQLKLRNLRQYQEMLITLRRTKKPCPRFARVRLLFECKEERLARLDALEAITVATDHFAEMNRSAEGKA